MRGPGWPEAGAERGGQRGDGGQGGWGFVGTLLGGRPCGVAGLWPSVVNPRDGPAPEGHLALPCCPHPVTDNSRCRGLVIPPVRANSGGPFWLRGSPGPAFRPGSAPCPALPTSLLTALIQGCMMSNPISVSPFRKWH